MSPSTTHLFCGRDGCCHLTAIIDCRAGKLVRCALISIASGCDRRLAEAEAYDPDRSWEPTRPTPGFVRPSSMLVFLAVESSPTGR